MISGGQFHTQLNDAQVILRSVSLLEGVRNYWTRPSSMAAMFRGKSYLEAWKIVYTRQLYDYCLSDFSLLQFQNADDGQYGLSYMYYDSPFNCLSYHDFVARELELPLDEAGDDWRDEYENYVNTCPKKESITPLRYDYDPEAYRPGIHPASHVHFGVGNEIRIATKKILKPMTFVLLVLRQHYPNEWRAFRSHSMANTWCRQVRDALEEIPSRYMNVEDSYELSLH